MARKKADQTLLKDQMLETAARLFTENGYDGTTVQQVIDALGASKGAFYHHFSSKEDLLDAVAEKMTQDGLDRFQPVLEDPAVPALERLIRYLNESRQWRLSRMGLIGAMLRMMHRDENAIIRRKINRRAMEAIQPIMARLVADGVAEGVFHTPDPSEAAALMIQLGDIYAETTTHMMLDAREGRGDVDLFERRINFYLDTYERLLGLENGTLPRVERDRIQMILTLIQSSEGGADRKEQEQ